MPAANKNEKQIMDISKPGKSVPSATAKPIIVGHGPMVQDPMVTSDTNSETVVSDTNEVEQPVVATPAPSKKIISPITTVQSDSTEAPEATTESVPDSTDDIATTAASEDSAVVDAIIDQVGNKVPATSDEDKKTHEHIEKLIAEKKYFVPLGKVNGKSGNGLLPVTLVLLVIFIGLIFALDADMIDAGFDLPFDLIK